MPEKEAIEILKKPCLCDYGLSHTVESCDISSCDKRDATRIAIQALEIVAKMKEHCEGPCIDCPYHNQHMDKCMNDLLKGE